MKGGYMRKAKWLIVPILFAALFSCTGWGGQAVGTYELMGVTLKVAHDTIRPGCDAGTLPADKCVTFKDVYRKGRVSYILAGDALSLAIITDDAIKRQAFWVEYNDLVAQYLKFTTEAIKVGREMGVIK